MKLCIDCKWHKDVLTAHPAVCSVIFHECRHPDALDTNPVDGHVTAPSCDRERDSGVCGKGGERWESKD